MFPQSLHYHIAPMVTDLVKWLRDAWEPAFDAFNNIVLAMLLKIEAGLMVVPWWLWILLVMVLSWYLSKHIGKTLLPALLLFSIGCFGLSLLRALKPLARQQLALWFIVATIVLLVAGLDELNQLYSGGRTGCPQDVILDFSGYLLFSLVYLGLTRSAKGQGL
jgi:ABC-type proline/glycine betaine transport system permease subunit